MTVILTHRRGFLSFFLVVYLEPCPRINTPDLHHKMRYLALTAGEPAPKYECHYRDMA